MKISEEVTDVLVRSRCENNKMFLPDQQLERSLYVAVNKALTALGGKWNRSAKSHIFNNDCEEILEQLIFTGEYVDVKKEFQFFETPPDVASKLWDALEYNFGATILEPSAGKGAILACYPGFKDCKVTAIELMEENHLELCRKGFDSINMDFLDHEEEYDLIIMNPPFSKMQDIAHVTHAISLATKQVVAIMSPSWVYRQCKKAAAFRELLEGYEHTWELLPEKSFKISGTNVNAGILSIRID